MSLSLIDGAMPQQDVWRSFGVPCSSKKESHIPTPWQFPIYD